MKPQALKNRIKEFKTIPASDLLDNPRNWRRHPDPQRAALSELMSKIGFAGPNTPAAIQFGRMVRAGRN